MAECMILRRINEDAGTGLNIVNLGTATSFNLLDFVPFVDLTKVTADNF